jgi:hypothetical protein
LFYLPSEKQRHCAVMMLVVSVMMDEFVQARTGRENCGPLEHRSQE